MRNRALVVAALLATSAVGAMPAHATPTQTTATPIKHVVVIFQENVSFDHYFATYPVATNPAGEPPFTAAAGHADRQRADTRAADHNPNTANPVPASTARRPSPATRTTTTRPSSRPSTAA